MTQPYSIIQAIRKPDKTSQENTSKRETKSKEEVKKIKQRDWNSKARRAEIGRQEKQTTRPKLKEG